MYVTGVQTRLRTTRQGEEEEEDAARRPSVFVCVSGIKSVVSPSVKSTRNIDRNIDRYQTT